MIPVTGENPNGRVAALAGCPGCSANVTVPAIWGSRRRSLADEAGSRREPARRGRRHTGMRLFLITVLGLLAVGLAAASPASADCPSPSMTFSPSEVDRGGEVIATGKYWGDNCYDTGPPPEGQGDLGEPLEGIEIVVVQGEREWVVGTVDAEADADYGFVTRIVVPRDAAPGDAQLVARRPETYLFVSNPDPMLRISSAPPTGQPPRAANQVRPRSRRATRTPRTSTNHRSAGCGSPASWAAPHSSLAWWQWPSVGGRHRPPARRIAQPPFLGWKSTHRVDDDPNVERG